MPLPVYQVLEAVAPWADVQDAPDSVGGRPIDETCWGRIGRGGKQSGLSYQLDSGDVESGVDSQVLQQLQTHRRRVYHSVDLEGAHEPRGQLLGLNLQEEVPGGQPDLLSLPVGRCGDPVAVSLPLDLGRRAGEGCMHLSPDPPTAPHVRPDRWEDCFLHLVVEQRWLVPQGGLEGGDTGGR